MVPRWIKPYGDTLDDGRVQLSFTLPVALDDNSKEAARRLARAMGLDEPSVVHAEDMGQGFSFYVVYGPCRHRVDLSTIQVARPAFEVLDKARIDARIAQHLQRKLVVVGACIETDAHTVGIDAIMNMKGYNHHYGLERYPEIEAHNLGAQVPNDKLIDYAVKVNADAILVSQIVTQKDVHVRNLTELVELLEARGLRERFVLCAGGTRISNKLAVELGYDAGFGQGTYAEHVATFLIERLGVRS